MKLAEALTGWFKLAGAAIGIPALLWGAWMTWQLVTDEPRLLVREAVPAIQLGQPVEVTLRFSVAGRRFNPVFVNQVLLREDVPPPPPLDLTFRDVIHVREEKDRVTLPAQPPPLPPRVLAIRGPDGALARTQPAPAVYEVFRGPRRRLDANDQLDFSLTVTLEPPAASATQPEIVVVRWIGLDVRWEDASGTSDVLQALVCLPLARVQGMTFCTPRPVVDIR